MTKLEISLELANLAGLTEKAKVEAVKYVVMCCTGIIPNGIDRYCTPIH